jgi:hypothetical protein
VKRCLHQPDTRSATFAGAIHYALHKRAADAPILPVGIDRDRADAGDDGTFIHAIAADDAACGLGDDAVNAWV